MNTRRGFTIVEILIVLVVMAILATIVTASYSGFQRRSADTVLRSEMTQARVALEAYQHGNNDFPPNLAGTNFAASNDVALKMYTNAPQTRTYQNLTPEQNAQLFLNACNASMPITSADGSSTFNTSCTFAGRNVHVSGTQSSNVVIQGPTITQSDFELDCGSRCDAAVAVIIGEFLAQNGSFPINVPSKQVALPAPTLTTYGSATKFCLEGIHGRYGDINYHVVNPSKELVSGPCPEDAELHYP